MSTKSILASIGRIDGKQWIAHAHAHAHVWIKDGDSYCTPSRNTEQAAWRSSRRSEVPSTSKDLSMVAWYLKATDKLHWEMSWLCQRRQTSTRIPHSYFTTLISLAKGGCRYLHPERTGVFGHSRLLFKNTNQRQLRALLMFWRQHSPDMVFPRHSDQTMDHSSVLKSSRALQTSTTFNTVLAAPISHPAMDKQREQYRQWRTFSKMLLTPFSRYSHIELPHSHGVEDHLHSYWWAGRSDQHFTHPQL